MPTFQFEAMDPQGQEIRDTIKASTQDEAQATIRAMGYFVTKIGTKEEAAQRVADEAFATGCSYVAVAVIASVLCGFVGLGVGWAMGSFVQGLGFGIIGMLVGAGISIFAGIFLKRGKSGSRK